MGQKFLAVACALILAAGAFAPEAAFARDRRGSDRGYHQYDRDWRDGRHHRRRHHDDDAAIAVGVLGLALGLALGAAIAEDDGPPQPQCWDNYQRCAPQQSYSQPNYAPQNYSDDGYSAYEEDYGPAANRGRPAATSAQTPDGSGACISQVEQWDPVAGRYVWINLRRPCES